MTKELLKVIKSMKERTTKLEEDLRQAKSLHTIAQHRQDHKTIGEILRELLTIYQPALLPKLDTIGYLTDDES